MIVMASFLFFSCHEQAEEIQQDALMENDSIVLSGLLHNFTDAALNDLPNKDSLLETIIDTLWEFPDDGRKMVATDLARFSLPLAEAGYIDYADSISMLSINLIKNSNFTNQYIATLRNRGIYFWIASNLDSAKIYFEKTIALSQEHGFENHLLAAKLNLVMVKKHELSLNETIDQLEELVTMCEKYNNLSIKASACNNLGNLYGRNGQYLTALEYYKTAIDLYEKTGEKVNHFNPMNNVGIIYDRLGMDSMAVESFLKLKELTHEAKNYRMYPYAFVNLSSLYIKRGNLERAYQEANEILNFLQEHKAPRSRETILIFNALGSIYKEKGDIKKAKYYLTESLKISDSLKYFTEIPAIANLLSSLYFETGDFDSAKIIATKYLPLAQKFGITDVESNIYYTLGETFNQNENYKLSSENYKLAYDLNKEILDEYTTQTSTDIVYYQELKKEEQEKSKLQEENRIKELQVQNKESMIRLQRYIIGLALFLLALLGALIYIFIRQARKQKQFNAILQEENDFKTNLFSIVSHDVRSPLVSIYSMFNMLEETEMDKDVQKRIQKDLKQQTEKTLDLIENLLFWTKKQLKGAKVNLEKINVHSIVHEVLNNELGDRALSNYQIKNEIDESLEIISDKNIIRLVFRNLVSNAIKYTPENGTIKLSMDERDPKNHTFYVADNGMGINEENQKKILNEDVVSAKGLKGQKGKGFGLNLCKFFLHKCNGKIWFDSKPGEGTTFYFSLPLIDDK